MTLSFRRTIPLGRTHLNLSTRGLSASRRFGPVSRRGSLRLGRGLRWIFGGGR